MTTTATTTENPPATTGTETKTGTPPATGAETPKAGEAGKDGTPIPGAEKTTDAPPPGAPATYTLKLPDGGALDAMDQQRIEKLARANNLSNDQAQSFLEATNAAVVEEGNSWHAELIADKTYGGDNLAETQRLANQLLDKVRPQGTPRGDGLRRLLSRGSGNNLEVVSFLADLGRMLQEDKPVGGAPSGGKTETKSIAEQLYPNSPEFRKQ